MYWHVHLRYRVICTIFVCSLVAMLALATSARAESSKPHPLWGNSILGNSAEIVSFSPGPATGHLMARIGDYTPSIQWMSAHDFPEGMEHELWRWQQLDVCSGDFDGDNDDDLVFVYDRPTANAYIHELRLVVSGLQSDGLEWDGEPAKTLGYSRVFGDAIYQSPSNLRIIPGQFNADDEALEFAVGYLAQSGFSEALDPIDYFGHAMTEISDLDGDGIRELAIGAAADDDGGTDRGALWIAWLHSDGTIKRQSKISDTEGGFLGTLVNGDNFGGHALASIGDLDGDGIDDLVASAIRDDDGGTNRGAVYVLFLNADGTVKAHQKISSTQGNFIGPLADDTYFGSGICSLGDLGGNGTQDIAVVGGSSDGGPGRGAVWILSLDTDGTVLDEQKISQTVGGFTGTFQDNQALGQYGGAATIGDLDGDDVPELAVGAAADADGGAGCGAVWVFFLNADGTVKAHQKISPLAGGFTGSLLPGDAFGVGLTAIGDVDGDEVPDLLVGARNTDDGGTNKGAVWILRLNIDGTVKSHQEISATNGGFFGPLDDHDYFGIASAWPGDINGDGESDLVVGAPGDDDGGGDGMQGAVWTLMLDPLNHDQTVESYQKNSMTTDTVVYRLEVYDFVGREPVLLSGVNGPACPGSFWQSDRFDITAGDFDGNGVDDIVMSGVILVPSSTDHQLFLNIYTPQTGSLVQRAAVETHATSPILRWTKASDKSFSDIVTRDDDGAGIYIDHIALATADLNSDDSVDEIVLAWERRDALWVWDWRVYLVTKEYDFVYWLQTGIVPLSVTTYADPSTEWTISGWDRQTLINSGHSRFYDDESSHPYFPLTGTSLGLATGDLTLTDDGCDEVVVASQDWIRVYRVDENINLLPHDVSISRPKCLFEPSRRVVSIVDLDAAIDSTLVGADWRPEVVVQDWTEFGGTKRFRVFRATPDGATIDRLDLLTTIEETGITQYFSDVAMAFGDFDGDAVRFGEPVPSQSFSFTQPSVILKSPPVIFDIVHNDILEVDETFDACGCYPGSPAGYQCQEFYAGYTQSSTGGVVVEQASVDDFGASTTLTQSASGKFKFLTAKVERSLTLKVGANFTREGRSTEGFVVTQMEDTKDDGLDDILVSTQQFRAWEYPVYRRDGDGDDLKGHYLVVQRQGDPSLTWKTAETWPMNVPYPVESVCGNILSYREFTVPSQDPRIAEMWLDDAIGHTTKREEPSFSVEYSWLDSEGLKTQWDYGFNVSGSAEVEADLDVFSTTAKIEVEASYEHSQIQTRRTTVGGGTRFEANFGGLQSTDAHYVIRPYIFRAKSGAIVMDYTAVPVNPESSWWNTHHYTRDPDPALRLPRFHHEAWGWDLTYPEKEYWSPDITVETDSARVGETVTLSVRIHNYSLTPLNGEVDVRFYVGDPDGGRWGSDANGDYILDNVGFQPIMNSQGESVFSTSGGGIQPREFQTVSMDWVVGYGLSGTLPKEAWIYAVIDSRGEPEVHDATRTPSNNKGYGGLIVLDAPIVVDAPQTPPKLSYALGQNVPNPFNPSTSIHFILEKPGFTSLKVYDRAGRLVTTLVNEELPTGKHVRQWNGHDGGSSQVASGVYFYRLESGDFVQTRRMVLLK